MADSPVGSRDENAVLCGVSAMLSADRASGSVLFRNQNTENTETTIGGFLLRDIALIVSGMVVGALAFKRAADLLRGGEDTLLSMVKRALAFINGGTAPTIPGESSPEAQEAKREEVATATASGVPMSPLLSGAAIPDYKTAQADDATLKSIASALGMRGGVNDLRLLYSFAGAESSFRAAARATTSSAQGLFQFTSRTWKYMMSLYPELGYSDEDRNVPERAARVANLYLGSIKSRLSGFLRREPSYGEIYLGYFLGPTGGMKFLQALMDNPGGIAAQLFPAAARANRNIFYEGGSASRPRTLRDVLAYLEGKVTSYSRDYMARTETESAPSLASAKQMTPQSVSSGDSGAVPGSATAVQSVSTVSTPGTDAMTASVKVASRNPQQSSNVVPMTAPEREKPDPQSVIRGRDGRLYKVSTG